MDSLSIAAVAYATDVEIVYVIVFEFHKWLQHFVSVI